MERLPLVVETEVQEELDDLWPVGGRNPDVPKRSDGSEHDPELPVAQVVHHLLLDGLRDVEAS